MRLTKTNFTQYLNCPNSLWLLKHKPEVYEEYKSEFSLFHEKLVREGYEVEEYVTQLFANPRDVETLETDEVADLLAQGPGVYLQATFQAANGAFARVDVLEVHEDKSVSLYEVKSSTSIKKDAKHNHLKDVAFQRYVLEQCGYTVRALYIIHLNKEFVKDGDIDPFDLLEKEQVDEMIERIYPQTLLEIEAALALLERQQINESMCTCLDKTKSNHCDTFSYFNKGINGDTIYLLNNIRAPKIQALRGMGVTQILDIPEDFELSEHQSLHRESLRVGEAIVDEDAVKETLDSLTFPLYFIDYETLPSAVPQVDGYKPHQHVPVQYSLHVMHEDGKIEHFEYLTDALEQPSKFIEALKSQIGEVGNLISWNKSYEQTKNREMAELLPEHANFLHNMNERTFDLMDIFKADYVDAAFKGSNSIKAIQPVLVPTLSYKELDVQSGTMAVDTVERMFAEENKQKREEMREYLLKYCELDTLAMVEIYNVLRTL